MIGAPWSANLIAIDEALDTGIDSETEMNVEEATVEDEGVPRAARSVERVELFSIEGDSKGELVGDALAEVASEVDGETLAAVVDDDSVGAKAVESDCGGEAVGRGMGDAIVLVIKETTSVEVLSEGSACFASIDTPAVELVAVSEDNACTTGTTLETTEVEFAVTGENV